MARIRSGKLQKTSKKKSYAGIQPSRAEGAPRDIALEVARRMTTSKSLDARKIVIKVSEKTVILKGSVPTLLMARQAEKLALGVQGVERVRNYLESELRGGGKQRAGGPHGGGEPPTREGRHRAAGGPHRGGEPPT